MPAIINISDLRKSYKGNPELILKGVDLTIEEGEFFGLLGPNAAGKTTLLSICLLYTSPSPRDRTRSRMPSSA
jgi:ABC-2 type transport system ATP-binding protein